MKSVIGTMVMFAALLPACVSVVPEGNLDVATTTTPSEIEESEEEVTNETSITSEEDDTSGDNFPPTVYIVVNESSIQNRPFIPISKKLKIFLPVHHSKLVVPEDSDSPIKVWIRLLIHEIVDVDVKNERVVLDVDIELMWYDDGIRRQILANKDVQNLTFRYVSIDEEFLRHVWKPDISFQELESAQESHLFSKKVGLTLFLKSSHAGRFQLDTRKIIHLQCDMDFRYYPADTQTCVFHLASYQYYRHELNLSWRNSTPFEAVYLNKVEDSNFQFQVCDVEPRQDQTSLELEYKKANVHFSALTFTLKIRRNLSYHLIQTYLPSVLLVLITCLCFLLPPDMVEARIGIAMTTVLTLTAMFFSIRGTSPEVSYTMAIDVWMVFCVFIVFLALVLFAVVYWARRKLLNLAEGEMSGTVLESGSNLRSISRRLTVRFQNGSRQEGPPTTEKLNKLKHYEGLVNASRKYSFLVYTLAFSLFLAGYSTWVFISSDYFIWSPDPYYNANEENGGKYEFILSTVKGGEEE